MRKRILSFVLMFALLLSSLGITAAAQAETSSVQDNGDTIILTAQNYVITIKKDGFRYSFERPDGSVIVNAHAESGVSFGKSGETSYPVVSTEYNGQSGNVVSFLVTNKNGGKANIKIHLFDTYARYEILPIEEARQARTVSAEQLAQEGITLLVKGSENKVDATVWKVEDSKVLGGDYTVEARVKLPANGTMSAGIYSHFNAKNAFHLFFIKKGAVALKRLNADAGSPAVEFPLIQTIDIKTDTWYTLKLVCEGKQLKGYVDGQLVVEGTDTAATQQQLSGTAGLRADKMDAYYDDFKVTSNDGQAVYYENDFETGNVDEVKQELTYVMGSQTLALDGTASVVNKYLQLTGNPTASAVTGNAAWTDYTVSADTSFGIGDEETSNGLVFGYQDAENYYGFRFGAGETLSLYKVVAGVETVLKSTTMPYSFDKNYTLKASMKGGTLTCYVDGAEKLTAEDGAFTTGKAGILTRVTASKTDNFKVTGASGDLFSTNFDDGKLDAWATTGKAVVTDGTPEKPDPEPDDGIRYYTIDARLAGGIEYLYGLGDYGATTNTGLGVRETSNIVGVNRLNAGTFTNQNSTNRFISNFTVAPQLGFAQVLFETDDKRVSYTADQTLLGAYKTRQVDGLYYFFGDMKQIYSDYKAVRNVAGYVDTKPHYEMFGLGWEAFGSLGWNAYQSSVESTLTDYLNSGYNLTWGVIGSGFWKGDRKALEGTTTSFGMWDDTVDPNGRTDGLPNPRFPDPEGLKTFFREHDMKLLVGLRNHLKLPASYKGVNYGGKWDESVDGRFVFEALDKGYFLTNDDGSLYKVNAKYPTGGIEPRGPVGVLDAENPEAVKWFSDNADLWGVDGFKEDCMMLQTTHHDDNWNKLQRYMAEEKDNLLIVRNASYCLPGDVLRINDANYGTSNGSFNNSPDRMVINSLAYAASGQSNVYPDIIGGTGANINDPNQQNYIVRNAYFAALCPSQSVGINVLKMNNQARKDAAFKAINWHSTYAPYIYDAALKSYETGYPTSMTPLYIAYPEDPNTYNMINSEKRMFQWMLGESILAAPLFGTDHLTATSRDVYLPEGRWIQYDTGEIFEGPVTLENREAPIDQMPAFVGGKGILVGEDMGNKGNYFIEVFPIAEKGTVYDYTFVDGETTSTVAMNMDGFNPNTLVITDTTEQKAIEYTVNENNRAVRFNYEPGHSYELTGGESEGKPYALEIACSDVFVGENIIDSVRLTLVMDDFTRIEDLTGYEIAFTPEDEGALSVQGDKLMALKAGKHRFKVTAAKDGDSITSNWVSVSAKERAIEIARPAFDDTLCTGSFLVSGQLLGVDEIEVFLTGTEGGEPVHAAELTVEGGIFSATFSEVEDGSYLLYAKEKNGDVEINSPLTVDTSDILFYDGFDGVSGFNWDKVTDGAAIAVNTEKGTLSGAASMTSDNKVASVITTAGEPILGEYIIRATMTFKGGTASAGLVFGYEDDKNYFHVRLDKSNAGGKAQLYRFVNGAASKAEPEKALSCRDNQPYLLEARVNGKTVQYYLDNQLVVEKTYDEDVSGKVGVRVYNVAADFNEIKVTTGNRKEIAVTTRYLDEDGKALSAEVTVWKTVGSTYRTEEKRFDGYILIETPDNAEGTVSDEGVEAVYRYHKIKPVTGVSLNKASANIYSNTAPNTVQLTAVVEPVDADEQGLTWSSDHPEIATVDGQGMVMAVDNGKATITVTTVDGGYTAACEVEVSTYYSPSTPPTTTTKTIKNDDGSTTKIVTDKKTGTVTETTKWPDGKNVEVVTTKSGNKTIAVTGQDGTKAIEMNIPSVIPAPEKPFLDIAGDHWAKGAVDFVSGLGLFTGGNDGAFSGEETMTRGMLAVVLHRLSGTLPGGENGFADVKPSSWYADSVAWATGNGIVTGNGTGFDPEGNITRESLAVMLCRYAGLLGVDTAVDGMAANEFKDFSDVSTWATEAMCWAVESGILKGSGGNLAPGTTATRAEVAVMLERFIGLITK